MKALKYKLNIYLILSLTISPILGKQYLSASSSDSVSEEFSPSWRKVLDEFEGKLTPVNNIMACISDKYIALIEEEVEIGEIGGPEKDRQKKTLKTRVTGPIQSLIENPYDPEEYNALIAPIITGEEKGVKLSKDDRDRRYDAILCQMFYSYNVQYFVTYLHMWEAIGKDLVTVKDTNLQKGAKVALEIAGSLSGLIPAPFGNVVAAGFSAAEKITEMVFVKKAREYAESVRELYTNKELTSAKYGFEYKRQDALAEQVAVLLTQRYSKLIVHLSNDVNGKHLKKLSRMTVVPMVDYAIDNLKQYNSQNFDNDYLPISELLARGCLIDKPNFLRRLNSPGKFAVKSYALMTHGGKSFDGWALLQNSAMLTKEGKVYIPTEESRLAFISLWMEKKWNYCRYGSTEEADQFGFRTIDDSPLTEKQIAEYSSEYRDLEKKYYLLLSRSIEVLDAISPIIGPALSVLQELAE